MHWTIPITRMTLFGMVAVQERVRRGPVSVRLKYLMAAAQKDGLEYYYLEDETPEPIANVPKSIAFLERLKY